MQREMTPERCSLLLQIKDVDDELEELYKKISDIQHVRLRGVERRKELVRQLKEVENREREAQSA